MLIEELIYAIAISLIKQIGIFSSLDGGNTATNHGLKYSREN